MEIIGALLISFVSGISTVFGAAFIFFKPKNINDFIGGSLAFSASIMLLISVTELIPEGFIYIEQTHNMLLAVFVLFSMLFFGNLISETINKKIKKQKEMSNNLYRVGVLSMIALMLHNLPEGILTFISSMVDIKLGLKFGIAIMLHNIPEGIAIAVPIYYATKSKKKAIKGTFISGLSEPLGALIAWIFLSRFLNNFIISLVLLFVAGLMISVSVNDIYSEASKYSRKSVLIGIALGCILFILNNILF